MTLPRTAPCTAFEGSTRIASGALAKVALEIKPVVDRGGAEPVLVFDDETGARIDLDLRGTPADVLSRLAPLPEPASRPAAEAPRGPGRPRLGVVAREVTLLPR